MQHTRRDEKCMLRFQSTEENIPLKRYIRICQDNTKKDITGIYCEVGIGFNRLVYGPVAGSRKLGNEPSCSLKGGELLDYLSDYQIPKHSAVWTQSARHRCLVTAGTDRQLPVNLLCHVPGVRLLSGRYVTEEFAMCWSKTAAMSSLFTLICSLFLGLLSSLQSH